MNIVTRAQWGARYRAGFGPRPLPVAEAYLHHSVTLAPDLDFRDLNADSVDDDEAAAMRRIEDIGQQRFGAGFSYNFAEMPSGRVYEGCGAARVGAHTKGRNTRALAVVLVGNYERDVPSDPMVDGLVVLLRHLADQGVLVLPQFTGGHRDAPGASTSCPGWQAYGLIPDVNRRALEEDDMTPEQSAQLAAAVKAGEANRDALARIEKLLETYPQDRRAVRLSLRTIGRKLGLGVEHDHEVPDEVIA